MSQKEVRIEVDKKLDELSSGSLHEIKNRFSYIVFVKQKLEKTLRSKRGPPYNVCGVSARSMVISDKSYSWVD